MGFIERLLGGSGRGGQSPSFRASPAGTLINQGGWLYREYTDAADTPFTIRLEQEKPGQWSVFEDYCHVAGLNLPDRRSDVSRFFAGSYRWLELEREPGNPYDANAIRILGTFRDAAGAQHSVQLGYVPREVAALLSGKDVGTLWPRIRFITFPGAGGESDFHLRFDLMQVKARKVKK
jgi:HIRAN domain-containing protein